MKKGTKVLSGYFADDGSFFENEKKCKDYEMKKIFNEFGRKLRYRGDYGCFAVSNYPGEVEYFAPKTEEDIKNFIMVMNYFGYTTNGITMNSPISVYHFDKDKKEYIDLLIEYNLFIRELNIFIPEKISEYHLS